MRAFSLRGRYGLGWCALAVIILAVDFASAQPAGNSFIELPAEGVVADVKQYALTRPDPDGELEAAALLRSDAGFVPFDPGLNEDAPPTWLKFHVVAPESSNGRYVLRVARRFFREFDLYTVSPDGPIEVRRANTHTAVDAETVGRQYVFDLALPTDERTAFLIHVDTIQSSLQPVELWIQDELSFSRTQSRPYLLFGLVFGILLALIIQNLVLYLNLRLAGHLYYVIATLSLLVMLGFDSGLLQNFLLPEALQPYVIRLNILFAALFAISTILFFRFFVRAERSIPRLAKVFKVGIVVLLILGISQIFVPNSIFFQVAMPVQFVSTFLYLLLIPGSIIAARKGVIEGWIFLVAWSIYLFNGIARSLMSLDVFERITVLEYLLYGCAVIEATILALGLAYRVRQLYRRHDEALREQHRAARLANLDPLTEAYNRRFLQTYLEGVVPESSTDSFDRAVLILDLDNFKETNDEYGHAAGDMVLRELVKRCRRALREGDVICRLGGDEFVIVLSDQADRNGLQVSRRILDEVAGRPFLFEGATMPVTTSIGVVSSISPKCGVSDILRMADQALYQAKQAGRNRAVLFDPDKATPFRHGPSREPLRYET
ncbi:diguanylate cyclase [Wenzhouxiangella sp. EGI_FJ10305]|uniref:diguanylate cyclase n=1 Tax=Wenzhouxiangella sp. EGI_FJ10305 TaxID=3243768 RepID=UPI0035D7C50A